MKNAEKPPSPANQALWWDSTGAVAAMATPHLRLLGVFEARLDDGPALFVSARKAQALLAYLAMSRGQPRTAGWG